jgi:hypothetical protein
MSTLISGSIDLTKIDKEKLVNGKYLNIQISINDNSDQYGNNVGIDGKDKEIALWIKTSKDGSKTFFSAKISEPYQAAEKVQENSPIQAKDDLPF